jgi:hypothetical protein
MPSSVIRRYRYCDADRQLVIEFVSGRRYTYRDVPEDVAEGFRRAFSKGEFFNAYIKDRFQFDRER